MTGAKDSPGIRRIFIFKRLIADISSISPKTTRFALVLDAFDMGSAAEQDPATVSQLCELVPKVMSVRFATESTADMLPDVNVTVCRGHIRPRDLEFPNVD